MKLLLLFLFTAICAQAAIVHVQIPPDQNSFFGVCPCAERREFDFNGDGINDLVFTGTGSSAQQISVPFGSYIMVDFRGGVARFDYDTYFDINVIRDETGIFGVYEWGLSGLLSYFHGGGAGGPWLGKTGYLAFRFDDLEYNRHFGWLRITDVNASLQFHEWAYETEDRKTIRTGQVPEPGTAALCAAGLLLAFPRARKPNL